MSLDGYDASISAGAMYNARNMEYNEGVASHNKLVRDAYDTKLKQQGTNISNLKDKKRNDAIIHDSADGYGLIGAGVSFLGQRKEYKEAATFGDYVKNVHGKRIQTLKAGLDDIKKTKAGIVRGGEDTGDAGGSLPTRTQEDRVATAKKSALGSGPEADETWNEATDDERSLVVKHFGGAPVSGAGEIVAGTEEAETLAAGDFKYEGTGLGAKILKAGLGKLGVTEAIGEGATGALSEGVGKVVGGIQGGVDLVEGVDNLIDGKGFFAQDGNDTAKKVGDSFVMAGAVLDAIGTIAPPLEAIGALATVTGGIIDTVDDWFGDKHKLDAAKTPIKAPSLENKQLGSSRISPAFQSLGLIASAPTSVKSRIQGSSTF